MHKSQRGVAIEISATQCPIFWVASRRALLVVTMNKNKLLDVPQSHNEATTSTLQPVRVKFISRLDPSEWLRYFPSEDGRWADCEFIFDRDCQNYDWLVVYDDVPAATGQARNSAFENVACPRENTLLVTTEPASIKTYGRGFAAQFGHVLTSQPYWALPHPNRHHQQAANHWFFGSGYGRWMSRVDLVRGPPPESKTQAISVVYSPKRQRHTLHAQRFDFIEAMRKLLPEMAVFGRGAMPMDDKAEALASFRYHLVVENHIGLHHITEKLTDAFLGRCLPFYAGAPDATDYFPPDSFIAIDIRNPVAAAAIIRKAIFEDAWTKRLPAIEEARRRTLEEQNIFAVLCRIISGNVPGNTDLPNLNGPILSRHAWRKRHKIGAIIHVLEKLCVRGRSLARKLSS